jgi:hypothetical protein
MFKKKKKTPATGLLQLVKMPVLSLIAGNNEMQVLAILLST